MSLQKAETFLPEVKNLHFFDKLKLMCTDLRAILTEEILNQDKRMKALKFRVYDRKDIFNSLTNFTDLSSYKNALSSLTHGCIPKIGAKTFLSQRLSASLVDNKFIQNRFDLFNHLYNNCSNYIEYDLVAF